MSGSDSPAVWLLALGQTLIYAGSYYAFPALLPDLEAATGWTKGELAMGPTLAFLIMAVLTPFTGRLVDRGLGGEMLSWMPALAALGVAALAVVDTHLGWLTAWAVIGVAQAGCLYETCFAFLTRRLGDAARAAITKVTLVAGFAGTLAFPLGHWLGEVRGGQGALLVFAAIMALVIPLNTVAVRHLRRRERAERTQAPTPPGVLQAALRKPAFWIIAAAFTAIYLNHGVLITFVLVLFADRGAPEGMAALAAALIGPSQVVGRLMLMGAGARVTTGQATRGAMAAVVLASGILWLAGLAPLLVFGFALIQGAGAGLMSILRPVLIAEVLGRAGFGVISGAAAVAPILASAAAPLVGAGLLAWGGPPFVYAACLGLAVVGLGLILWLLARPDDQFSGM
ncbi:MAG: MFS transporter [Tabrizicola sp.]|uniref:MFS transporter n=1 Tax=Tabrizicola sp. TaxID=2005166 RepID=UPI0027344F91|nr:MFS transporter [Tabrizicola sp.]MDP3262701.1 MFS transporter [Tabrizicola sp.]MDP3648897.1 MFS transporter [Paracoccaceae bacterium]MDZ4067664.1 MFS transporter [Tabrizicola sp.]